MQEDSGKYESRLAKGGNYLGWENYPTYVVHHWIWQDTRRQNYWQQLIEAVWDAAAPQDDIGKDAVARFAIAKELETELVAHTPAGEGLYDMLGAFVIGLVDSYQLADSWLAHWVQEYTPREPRKVIDKRVRPDKTKEESVT